MEYSGTFYLDIALGFIVGFYTAVFRGQVVNCRTRFLFLSVQVCGAVGALEKVGVYLNIGN